eukprot:2647802-Pyramimonas_sp.AAC.1
MATPCHAPDTYHLFVKLSFLMPCPWERGTRSNVCAVLRPMILMLLPVSKNSPHTIYHGPTVRCRGQLMSFSEYPLHL